MAEIQTRAMVDIRVHVTCNAKQRKRQFSENFNNCRDFPRNKLKPSSWGIKRKLLRTSSSSRKKEILQTVTRVRDLTLIFHVIRLKYEIDIIFAVSTFL